MKGSLYTIIIGIFFITVTTAFYLKDSSSYYYIPLMLSSLIIFIGGLFNLKKYKDNDNHYLVIVAAVLVVMWIVGFIQPFSPVNTIIYYIETGVITLTIIAAFRNVFKAREKIEEVLEHYDKILAVNPDDITALNNKGVKLAGYMRYNDVVRCFDKILEINSGNTTALHNRDFAEEMKDHTVIDYFKKIPIYTTIEKEGGTDFKS